MNGCRFMAKQISDVMRHLGSKSSPKKAAAAKINAQKKRPKKITPLN